MHFTETRSLHYRDEKSEKFWNITLDSNTVSVHFGPTTI
jgi:predicted DNA-binding WGR domain protein